MAVPTVITDLSATASSNSPAGGDAIGTSLDDFLRVIQAFERQLFDTSTIYSATVGGTADVITLTPSVALTAHKEGQGLAWVQASANTASVTVNPSGIGAKDVTKNGSTALEAGDLPAGALIQARYDGTRYQLTSISTSTTAPFSDTTAIVKGSADATKLLRFEVDGITTGTTRVLTPPNYNGTIATLAGTETLTNKTIAGGSNTLSGITEAMLSTSDNTTLDVTTSKHGFAPKAPNDTSKFLRGDATWAAPSNPIVTALGVGSFIFAYLNSGSVAAGGTVSSTDITPCRFFFGGTAGMGTSGDSITGTWQSLQALSGSLPVGMFQRIS